MVTYQKILSPHEETAENFSPLRSRLTYPLPSSAIMRVALGKSTIIGDFRLGEQMVPRNCPGPIKIKYPYRYFVPIFTSRIYPTIQIIYIIIYTYTYFKFLRDKSSIFTANLSAQTAVRECSIDITVAWFHSGKNPIFQ